MTLLDRRTFLLSSMAAPSLAYGKPPRKWHDEISAYRVSDPLAGYFDFEQRRKIMRNSLKPVFVGARRRLDRVPSCEGALEIPIQDQAIVMPSFYEQNDAWRVAVTPFRDFEDAVSNLAGANLVAADRRYADCLIDLLLAWAERNGLANFNHALDRQQGWFQVESTLFAIGHALAAIRPDMLHREADLKLIDAWLLRVARSHFAIPGQPRGTCCNNHYYRRCLHASIIGVLTKDDDLFQSGVGAIYSALSGATPDGALPLEMKRGKLAPHYQNFALMYLAMIAQIAERQGYDMWELEIDGVSLHSLNEVNNRIIADPYYVRNYVDVDEVSLRYRNDSQYFAWFEIYLSKFKNAQMEAWVADRRPLYNRSLGGHLTAYFHLG